MELAVMQSLGEKKGEKQIIPSATELLRNDTRCHPSQRDARSGAHSVVSNPQ